MNSESKTIKVGVPTETFPDERRVAIPPEVIPTLKKLPVQFVVERGAGLQAGFTDQAYEAQGAHLATREEVFSQADVIAQVRGFGSNQEAGKADLEKMRSGQVVVSMLDPLSEPGAVRELAQTGVQAFALELMPRITRAQSMDVLSSMATVAGYKAVLLAAEHLPKFFPMMMTAAGTIAPAKVFVIGAGVAGLQACATAKRLGAVVEAYDVRPAVKDQVKSVGAEFVEFDLEIESAEDQGGYAKEQSEEFIRKQQEQMKTVVTRNHVVITTAAIPGKKSPVLITRDMVESMMPGSVIIDLAAERGGNCELTQAGEAIKAGEVTILGPLNLPATVPFDASRMFGKNVVTFLKQIINEEGLNIDLEDQVIKDTLVAREGDICSERIRQLLET